MKQQRTTGIYIDKTKKVIFNLPVVSYEENRLQVIYAPSIDLFGYGKSMEEAKQSFNIALEEFIRYTTRKKTLATVLKQLGWVKKKKEYKAPPLGYLIKENDQFNSIFNEKDFKKFNQQVELAIA